MKVKIAVTLAYISLIGMTITGIAKKEKGGATETPAIRDGLRH